MIELDGQLQLTLLCPFFPRLHENYVIVQIFTRRLRCALVPFDSTEFHLK